MQELTRQLGTFEKHSEGGVASVVAVVFRRRYVLLAVLLCLMGGTVLFTSRTTKRYEASMQFLVKNDRLDPVISPLATPQFRGEVTEQQMNSEVALLTSEDVLREVVRRCRLDQLETGSWLAHWLSSDGADARFDAAALRLRRDLQVAVLKTSDVIEVDYAIGAPRRAAAVLRTLADVYLSAHLQLRRPTGTEEFFATQTNEWRLRLADAELKIKLFNDRHSAYSLSDQKALMIRRLVDTQAALDGARTSYSDVQKRMDSAEEQMKALDTRIVLEKKTVPNQYSIERLGTMMAELENKRTDLLTKFRPDDRMVLDIDTQLATTRRNLETARQNATIEVSTGLNPRRLDLESRFATLHIDLVGSLARIRSIGEQLQEQRDRLEDLNAQTAGYDALQRELKDAQDNYDLYNKKREDAETSNALDRFKFANIAIAESPVDSDIPVWPRWGLNLALGLLVASFLGGGLAYTLESMRDCVYTAPEIEQALGLPAFATIPFQRADNLPYRQQNSTRLLPSQ